MREQTNAEENRNGKHSEVKKKENKDLIKEKNEIGTNIKQKNRKC